MKKQIIVLGFLSSILGMSCQMNLDPYHETIDRLDFVYEQGSWSDADADSTVSYTFAYLPQGRNVDTVWLNLETIGYVMDYDRPISLKQIPAGNEDAEPDVHYVPFDDLTLSSYYNVPAGEVNVSVPIVLKRDPSLLEKTVYLKIAIEGNDYFQPGSQNRQTKTIMFSDVLLPLQRWAVDEDPNMLMNWGEYGPVKHRFMIDATASMGVVINDAFVDDLFDLSSLDMGLITYWTGFFQKALKEENARRAAQGLDILREDPLPGETIGKEVEFSSAW